jgi:Mn2+/Fe2+ NRAMP family transporter
MRSPSPGVRGRVRTAAPRIGPLARLRDRLRSGDLLRLRPRFRGRGLLAFLAVMGPGLIAGIAGNEAGGITTYSVMGADTGFRLLWLFPLTTAILILVQEMAARLGVVTGQGLSDLIRDWFGVRWTVLAMIVLFVANLGQTVAEFAGVAAALEIFGIPRFLSVPLTALGIWALVLFASYRTVERVFLSVILVFITYIVTAVISRPDWGMVGRALVTPTLDLAPSTLLLMVALVGTTITPYMQFYLQSAVAEKGIDEEELRLEQADAIGGAVWTNVVALFIVIATAQTLHAAGIRVDDAADAAQAFGPVAGQLSQALFAVGLFGASVLAGMILPISTAFVICEAFGWESGVGKPFRDAPAFFGIYTFTLAAGALIVLLPFLPRLIDVLLVTQNLQGLLLPVVLIFMYRLVNNRRLLGRHANGRLRNAATLTAIALVVALDAILIGVTLLGMVGIRLG